MRIFTKTATHTVARNFLFDLLTGIKSVDYDLACTVADECDLVFEESFVSLPGGGFYNSTPDCIAVCPRNDKVFDKIARQWHDTIGRLLPIQSKTVDYPQWIAAMKGAGYSEERVADNITGFSFLKDVIREAEGKDVVKPATILQEEYEVFKEYQRSLFDDRLDEYPTLDLWSPLQLESFIKEGRYSRIYCAYYGRRRKLKLYNVAPRQKVHHCKIFLDPDVAVELEDYQDFYLETKGQEAEERRRNERRAEFESRIDYSLVPPEDDILTGRWVPTTELIIQSHRISEYLKMPTKDHFDDLKPGDFGKPPLWDAIWLFFNTEGKITPLTPLQHEMLNEIVRYRLGDSGACWLYELADRWTTVEEEDKQDYDEAFIQYCQERESSFVFALKNLSLNQLVVVEKPDLRSHGIINISLTPKGMEAALLEAERYDAHREENDFSRADLTRIIANFNQARDFYVNRGIFWKHLVGKGWFIELFCESRAKELGLEKYIEPT